MRMSNQNCLQIHKILLLWFTVQARAKAPLSSSIKFRVGEYVVLPNGSMLGLVDGIDKYMVEFDFFRLTREKDNYPNNTIYPQKKFKGVWNNASCSFDVSLCPETFGECYCRNSGANYFKFFYNTTATIGENATQFRAVWESSSSAYQPGITREVTLPYVCEQLKVTYTTQGKTGQAVIDETNMVEKDAGSTSLTFEVTNLVPPYEIAIQRNGTPVNTSFGYDPTLTTSVTESDIGIEFALFYTEFALFSCGRLGIVRLVYIPMPVVPTAPPDGMTPEPDGHPTDSPGKPSAEKNEQGSDTGMIIGVVLAAVVGSLIGLILFATNSRATGVQAEAEGTGVQVNWSSALFPFKGETLVVNRKGAKDPYTSKDISKNESSVHSEDSKKHAASVNDLPPDTYTVSVVTNRWGWNTKSKATNFVVEGVEESQKAFVPPVTTSTEFAQYGTVV